MKTKRMVKLWHNKGNPIKFASGKIERNDPCPCRSGKKYKKCCMGKTGERT